MAYQFTPTEDFVGKVNDRDNNYLKGKLYTVRDGALYADLDSKVKNWEKNGKVRILGEVPNSAPISINTE